MQAARLLDGRAPSIVLAPLQSELAGGRASRQPPLLGLHCLVLADEASMPG